MRVQPESPQRTDEQRSYFPDWTPHLPKAPAELEADHNSYLAGGYAEEFGYLARPGVSRGVPVLDGEPPEDCAEWRCEAAAMHPGYPITPWSSVMEALRRELPKYGGIFVQAEDELASVSIALGCSYSGWLAESRAG